MLPKNMLIIASDHPVDAVLSVGRWMAAGFASVGVNCDVVSIPRDNQRLAEILQKEPLGVIALGPMALNITIEGRYYIWQALRCPVCLFMLDAIIYDYLRVPSIRAFIDDARVNENLWLISPEGGYFDLLRRTEQGGFFPNQTRHVPFGHFANLASAPRNAIDRICVIGTLGNELGLGPSESSIEDVISNYGHGVISERQQKELVETTFSHTMPDMPLRFLMQYLCWRWEEVFELRNLKFICAIDSYIKRLRRFSAVRSLCGMPVDFYGTGWSAYFPGERDFRFLGSVSHGEIASTIASYKAVINFDPNWESGVHDRVFTSCAMGVPVITNENSALEGLGLPGRLVHAYSANAPDLRDVATKLIKSRDEPTRFHVPTLTEHSWTNRAATMMAILYCD